MSRRGNESLEVTSLSAVEHILNHCPTRIRTLYVKPSSRGPSQRMEELIKFARREGVAVDVSPRARDNDEPVRALLHNFEYVELETVMETAAEKKNSLVILLDHLQDPQNFGAIARTAEALGADGIVIPKDRGVTVTSGVYSASVGAIETIPVALVVNLGEACRKLKEAGYWIVGSALGETSKPLHTLPDFDKVALIMGTELEGISRGLEAQTDWLVEIPIQGKVQSLNVSAAGAILMHEIRRRWKN